MSVSLLLKRIESKTSTVMSAAALASMLALAASVVTLGVASTAGPAVAGSKGGGLGGVLGGGGGGLLGGLGGTVGGVTSGLGGTVGGVTSGLGGTLGGTVGGVTGGLGGSSGGSVGGSSGGSGRGIAEPGSSAFFSGGSSFDGRVKVSPSKNKAQKVNGATAAVGNGKAANAAVAGSKNALKGNAGVLSGRAKGTAKITTGADAQGSVNDASQQSVGGLTVPVVNVLPAGQTNGALNALSTPGGNKPIVQFGDKSSTSPILGLGVNNGAAAPVTGLALGANASKPLLKAGALGEAPVLGGVAQKAGLQSALGGDLTVGVPDLKLNLPKLPKLGDLPDLNIDVNNNVGGNVNVVDIDVSNGGGGGGGGSVEIGGFVSVIDEDVLTRCIRVVRNPSRYTEREVRVCRLVIARVRREVEQHASAE
jgi:hypothetical protein